jgi:hypothetical protein
MNKCTVYILTFITLTNCINGTKRNASVIDSLRTQVSVDMANPNSRTKEVMYEGKNYKLTLMTFDTVTDDESRFNSILTLSKRTSDNYFEIFKDSIFSTVQKVNFNDYDSDGLRDILVQNISDARSNWTYYLYLVDTTNDHVKKIRGFEQIKNPRFIAKYNLIDNYVNSGRNWTEFYKIEGDSIFNYGITIYKGEDDNGNVTFEQEFQKTLKEILSSE